MPPDQSSSRFPEGRYPEVSFGWIVILKPALIYLYKFLIAKNPENDEIIATIAVRGYDKKFKEFEGLYNKENTASIWRLYVDEKYRRLGLATKLFKLVESFSYLNSYKEIYLHTHKNLNGGLNFWKKMGFETTVDTNNDLQTVHMIKKLPKFKLNNVQSGYNLAIESLTLF